MRRIFLALFMIFMVAAPAAASRYRGIALSDAGVFVRFSGTLRRVAGNVYLGQVVCRPGSTRCLFAKASARVTLYEDGSFAARLQAGQRAACNIAGIVTVSGLEGRYACATRSGASDTGVFQLDRF